MAGQALTVLPVDEKREELIVNEQAKCAIREEPSRERESRSAR